MLQFHGDLVHESENKHQACCIDTLTFVTNKTPDTCESARNCVPKSCCVGLELGSKLTGSITHGYLGKAKSCHLRGRPFPLASQWGPCFLNNVHGSIVVSGRQETIFFLPINHYGPATSGYVHQKVTTQALLLNSQRVIRQIS